MTDSTVRDGRSLGTLTPTPEEEQGTHDLVLSDEVARTFHEYARLSSEAALDGGEVTTLWTELGFEGAVHALHVHMLTNRFTPPHVESVRLFTIDEAAHGSLDIAIDQLHDALRRIEKAKERAEKLRKELGQYDQAA